MTELKKSELDAMIRQYGIDRINLDGMTPIASGTFLGKCAVEGDERFYEVKVTAKSKDFTQSDVDAILVERAEVEARKAEKARIAQVKREADEAKRAAKAAKPKE